MPKESRYEVIVQLSYVLCTKRFMTTKGDNMNFSRQNVSYKTEINICEPDTLLTHLPTELLIVLSTATVQ